MVFVERRRKGWESSLRRSGGSKSVVSVSSGKAGRGRGPRVVGGKWWAVWVGVVVVGGASDGD